MYLKGAIEKTGTGTEDMVKQCRNWGLPDPEFTDGPDFRIVIRRQTAINPPVNPPVNPLGSIELTSSARAVLSKLKIDGRRTYATLASELRLHRDTIRVSIASLVKAGLVIRVGSDKRGYWKVVGEKQ